MSLDKLRKVAEDAGKRNLWVAPIEAHTSVSDHVCLPAPWLLALLDGAAFVDDFLFGCEDPNGNLTDANLAELRDRAIALADRLREVAV